MSSRHYYAETPGRKRKKPRRSTAGRICAAPNCDTILSVYNHDPTCFTHTPPKTIRTRGRKRIDDDAPEMIDTTTRCYACSLRLGGWGQPAEEVKSGDTWHWIVSIAGSPKPLCEIR